MAALLFLVAIQMGLLRACPTCRGCRRSTGRSWSSTRGSPSSSGASSRRRDRADRLGVPPRHRLQAKLALGYAILHDWRAYGREVASWQAGSWLARVGSTFFFLRAFHVDATAEHDLAVLVVGGLSTLLPPFTPGGAGTQQAILVFALAGAASSSTILAFSFGLQLVNTIVYVAIGFGAILLMLGTLHGASTSRRTAEMRGRASPPEPP